MKKKSIPGAVLGIIGAVFAIIGGLGLAFCAEVVAGASGGAVNYTWAAYVLGLGSGIVGLVGAILDFSRPKIGGVLQIIAAIMGIIICIKAPQGERNLCNKCMEREHSIHLVREHCSYTKIKIRRFDRARIR